MPLRTIIAASAIALALACTAGPAGAQQIYTWKDAGGVTHFSQSPPPTGTRYSKLTLSNAPEVSSNPPAGTGAEGDSPAPAARTQTASAGATQPDTPANRAELCKQLGSNIALLQGKQPVVEGAGSGKQTVMSDNAREQQLATARAQQAQYCSSGGT